MGTDVPDVIGSMFATGTSGYEPKPYTGMSGQMTLHVILQRRKSGIMKSEISGFI